ncbi:MAG: GNAT family N-acetyltransferase, partial [Planctomycetota bacterium]|nr:GNAT family N-acetyltransferase [Planctomycetota bacterium]
EPQTSEYCVAYKNGVPSGSASMTHFDGFTHFNGAEVAPRARRQGIYRALCLERMRVLRARGVTLVTNHCRQDTSAPICTRMGFDTICAFKVYVFGKA